MGNEGVITSASLAIEQGMMSMLQNVAIHRILGGGDAFLVLLSILCVAKAVPNDYYVVRRLSGLTYALLYSTVINMLLDMVVIYGDNILSLINILGVFMITRSLHSNDVNAYAQYMTVSNAGEVLLQYGDDAVALASGLAIFAHIIGWEEETVKLLATQCVITTLKKYLPLDFLLISVLAIVYITHPFSRKFPMTAKVMKYAVFATSSDSRLIEVPHWLMAIALSIIQHWEVDEVITAFASYAGAQAIVLAFIESASSVINGDPILVLVSTMIGIRIFLEISTHK